MSAHVPQVVEPVEFIGVDEYSFSGDTSTLERKHAFLAAYRVHGVVSRATHEARIHRTTVYKWLDSDEAFVQAFADCHEDTYDELEASGFQKALAGDPILTMFYLKAHRPKFRDRMTIDVEELREQVRERIAQLSPAKETLQITCPTDNKQKD